MNIVFFGTAEFAVESLRALLCAGHTVSLVVTQPDAKKGRHLHLSPPPVKVLAEAHGIPVYQPKDASSVQSAAILKDTGAELFVVIAYGQILKKDILAIPRRYAVNVHGSLLPKYRGAAPTNWAVINGDVSTGVTIIRLNEKMDEGDVIACREIAIGGDDTNITLSERLADAGAALLIKTVDRIGAGVPIDFAKQDPAGVTYAPKLRKEDGLIRWDESAVSIHNKVRGLLPWPGAYTYLGDKILKILKSEITHEQPGTEDRLPGTVIDILKNKGMVVRAGSGSLLVTHVQLECGKELDVGAFLRGHRIAVGCHFGS